MSKTRFMKALVAIATLVAALLLAACGGGGGGSSSGSESESSGPVEIEFWHGQTQGTAKEVQEMIDEFNETHPDVKVSKDSGGVNSDRMLQKVTAGLQAGNYPDIAYIYGSDLANLARGEQLANLSEAVENGEIEWDNYVPAAQEAATVEGEPRAVPAFVDNLAVVYNTKIFEEAGVAVPDRRMDLGRIPRNRGQAEQQEQGDRRLRLAGHRRRGHDLADLAAGLADGRRSRQRRRHQGRLRRRTRRSGAGSPAESAGRRLGLHRQHRRQRTDAAAVRQRQDGDEHRRSLHAARIRRSRGRIRRRLAALLRRRTHDDLRPGHLGGVRQRRSAGESRARVPQVVERTEAAAQVADRLGQPAADQGRRGSTGVLEVREQLRRASTQFVENTKLARTRPTIPTYPAISQAMGKAIAEVLYGKADPKQALEGAVSSANHELELEG